MSTESLTLTLPSPLARELDVLGRELLTEILQRGLVQWRIEKALERYAAGGFSRISSLALIKARNSKRSISKRMSLLSLMCVVIAGAPGSTKANLIV